MKSSSLTITAAVLGILGASTCFAQTPNPPASGTSPSSASSPSQREATQSRTAESQATPSPSSDTSTPHQREAMAGKKQTMKECMDTQAAKTSGMSKADMTKACDEQMKMQKDRERLSKAPATTPATTPPTTPKNDDASQTPAPK